MGRFFGLHSATHHNHFPQSDLVVPDCSPSTPEAEVRSKVTGSWRPEEITCKLLALRGKKTQTGMVVQACILYQHLGS